MLSRWSRSVQATRVRPALPRRARRFRPLCEVLEERSLLAVNIFTVNSTAGDNSPGTLRWAIEQANATANLDDPDRIEFQITGPGPHVISLEDSLAAITEAVEIDGTTQFGYLDTPLVQVDGDDQFTLFVANTGGVTIQGLSITRSVGSGIALNGDVAPHDDALGSFIVGNWIGLDLDGLEAGNAEDGVHIHSDNNIISANVISGNQGNGILIEGHNTLDADPENNVVQGNFIGTNVAGTAAIGNYNGVVVKAGAKKNLIGDLGLVGDVPGAGVGNLISGNRNYGIAIVNSSLDLDGSPPDNAPPNNVIQGNFIGTNVTGGDFLSNLNDGIWIYNSGYNLVGGDAFGNGGNLISGNLGSGVFIGTGNSGPSIDSEYNQVSGNYIGTKIDGLSALRNQYDGVFLDDTDYNLIGGSTFATGGNVIAANGYSGVYIYGGEGNEVSGNYIGVDVTGLAGLGNEGDGVTLEDTRYNLVGGPSFADGGNVIAANLGNGVAIYGGEGGDAYDNDLHGNYIGLGKDGVTALGNFRDGVLIDNAHYTDVAFNVIGDHNHSYYDDGDIVNVVGVGVHVYGGEGTTIRSNKIGTDVTGALRRANNIGILLRFAYDTTIGGTFLGDPDDASLPPDGNIIAASAYDSRFTDSGTGVLLYDSYYTTIQANFIGLNRAGAVHLGNDGDGVRIVDAGDNLIGDQYGLAGNTIAHNGAGAEGGNGISVIGDYATGNAILANSIFSNQGLGIDLGDDGPTDNDPLDADGDVFPYGPNHWQNYPELTTVARTLTGIAIDGFLDSAPNQDYHIEFFANLPGDPEGRIFLGAILVTTDGAGHVDFNALLPLLPSLPTGLLEYTATATLLESVITGGAAAAGEVDPDDYYFIETSEFSPAEGEQFADLAVVKTADKSVVDPGDLLKFTISVGNNGPFDVDHVTLLDLLPSNVTFVSYFTSNGSTYDPDTGIWDVGALPDDGREALVIFVRVKPDAGGSDIFNKACIETASLPDPFPDNNCDSVTVPVRKPRVTDLAVTIVGQPLAVEAGNALTYVVSAVNNGPLDSPATLVLALDPGTAYLNITVPAGWLLSSTPPPGTAGGNVVLTTTKIVAGGSAVFVMDVLVDPTLPNNTILTAKAAISSPLPESTLVNNFDFALNRVIDTTDDTGIPPGSIGQVLIDEPAGLIEIVDNRVGLGAPPTPTFFLADVRSGLTNNIPFFQRNIPTANTSGIINGIVFEDANGNGSRDLNEVVLDGMVFYLTRLRSDDFDESRPVATTGRDGDFRFEGLAPGVYVVRPVPNRFYAVSAPQDGFYQVVVGAERSATVTFGVRPLGGRRRPIIPSSAAPLPSRGTLALDELLPADSCLAVPLDGVAAEVELRDAVFCGADLETPLAAEDDSSGIDWLAPVALASLLATTLIRPRSREQDRRLAL